MIGDRSDTEGRRAFVGALDRTTSRELARALGVSTKTVSAIACGTKRPSLDLAVVIEWKLGIPCASWCTSRSLLRVDGARVMLKKSGDSAA